jgi:hypothetical protein
MKKINSTTTAKTMIVIKIDDDIIDIFLVLNFGGKDT